MLTSGVSVDISNRHASVRHSGCLCQHPVSCTGHVTDSPAENRYLTTLMVGIGAPLGWRPNEYVSVKRRRLLLVFLRRVLSGISLVSIVPSRPPCRRSTSIAWPALRASAANLTPLLALCLPSTALLSAVICPWQRQTPPTTTTVSATLRAVRARLASRIACETCWVLKPPTRSCSST